MDDQDRTELLQRALRLATEVALAAGERLRAEFFRPAGPRGSGEKAEIDLELEVDIRAQLLEAFPTWSYLGEETGNEERGGPARWVVDPNDGTSAFLKGARGSSVSIGLLWESEPVLGVIYSPLYPDHGGDLLTWARGCGPLMRNGSPVLPPEWVHQLSSTDVVMVSQRGDNATAANLECVQPARFRCMPGIAYRFALVAAGEASAGVSLGAPSAHDFAACHALLRGQGATMLDQDGQPVLYGPEGRSSTTSCFAGSSEVCKLLAQRPWTLVFQGRKGAGPSPLVKESRDRIVTDSRRLSRALGCWMGQLTGDSLGSLVEFRSAETIEQEYPNGPRRLIDGGHWSTLAGQPTDDSELALCLARTLIGRDGYEREATWEAYRRWYDSDPFDVGHTTSQGLCSESALSRGRYSASQANGALMRCSPLALASWSNLERAMAWSDDDASITHPHPVCLEANRAFIRAVIAGLNGAEPDQMARAAREGANGGVLEALERADREPPGDFVQNMGWVLLALQNAFYRLLHAPSLEEGVVQTVRAGGDTDTNGCIAGALLGAAYGLEAVPKQWLLAVLSCRPEPHFGAARRPRPSFCWPVDAHQVAERLLAIP